MLLLGGMLFANAVGDVITLIVIAITFLGWIINLVSAKNKMPPPPAGRPRPPAPPRPRNDKLQDEINIFIEDLSQRDKTRESKPTAPTAKGNAGAPGGRRKRPAEPQQPPPVKSPPKRRVPGDEVVNRPSILRERLGSGVREHAAANVDPQRLAQEVAADVGDRVKQSVSEHLGTFSGGVAPPMRTTSMGAAAPVTNEMVARLRNPATIRDAFIINAILARPVRKPRT